MATGTDIVNDAMFAIGASSDINPASSPLFNASYRRLKQWVVAMAGDGVDTGADVTALPDSPAAEFGNDPKFDLALSAGLAPWLAPLFQIELPITHPARGAADQAMRSLYVGSLKASLPEWPETLPVGAGNTRGPKGRVFFEVPDDPFGLEEVVVTP